MALPMTAHRHSKAQDVSNLMLTFGSPGLGFWLAADRVTPSMWEGPSSIGWNTNTDHCHELGVRQCDNVPTDCCPWSFMRTVKRAWMLFHFPIPDWRLHHIMLCPWPYVGPRLHKRNPINIWIRTCSVELGLLSEPTLWWLYDQFVFWSTVISKCHITRQCTSGWLIRRTLTD